MNHSRTGWLAFAIAALCATFAAPLRGMASPMSSDGFTVKVSEGLEALSSLSKTLLDSLTLVAQDRPQILITNTSTSASITSFTLTVNNSEFQIGSLFLNNVPGIGISGNSPGTTPGLHAGSPTATVNFDGLGPGFIYPFRIDVDRAADHGMSLTNYREALASGSDPSNWATVDVTFSDGQSLHQVLTPMDIFGTDPWVTYTYYQCSNTPPPTAQISVSAHTVPVPEPATSVMAVAGGVLMAVLSLWRRRRAS